MTRAVPRVQVARALRRSGSCVLLPLAAATTLAALRWRDPHLAGSWPPCPLRAMTGLPCPGCGGLRALAELGSGHLTAALGSNALVVVLVGALVVAWPTRVRRDRATGPPVTTPGHRRVLVLPAAAQRAVVVTALGFGVLRLLPGTGLLGP
jgi:hypothetical protein